MLVMIVQTVIVDSFKTKDSELVEGIV